MDSVLLFIKKVHNYFVDKENNMDSEKHTLLRSMKLSEEVWELNEQILLHYWYWRKWKNEKYSQENLEWELADVIFSTLMIAESLDIDMNSAMNKKIKLLKNRFNIN